MRVLLATLVLMIAACAKPHEPAPASPVPAVDTGAGDDLYPREDGDVQEKTIEDLRAESLAALDREACEADGGEVRQEGKLGMWRCVRAYADAGKICRGKADCEGKCLLPPDGQAATGEEANGACQATDSPFGCYAEVEGGRVAAALCVD